MIPIPETGSALSRIRRIILFTNRLRRGLPIFGVLNVRLYPNRTFWDARCGADFSRKNAARAHGPAVICGPGVALLHAGFVRSSFSAQVPRKSDIAPNLKVATLPEREYGACS